MTYNFEAMKKEILGSEDGLKTVLFIKDNASRLLSESGAFKASHVFRGYTGDIWLAMAALDYLVQFGMLFELTGDASAGQDRVFIEAV